MSISVGLGSGSTSAKIATANTSIIHTIAIQNSGPSRRPFRTGASATDASMPRSSVAMADPWIEHGVEHVDDEVHQHESGTDQQHHALQDDEIAGRDRADQQPADARQREHRLDDDGAADQSSDIDAGDRDERQR